MNTKQIAIIGLGGIAGTHRHHLNRTPGLQLAGGVDISPGRRDAFIAGENAPAYASFAELLEARPVDGIVVATPPTAREAIVLQALEAGVAVLSEKPLAADAATARRLAAHPRAALLRVGYCHRWTEAAQEARRLIEAGELGELVSMQVCFSGWAPAMKEHWMTDPAVSGGGALVDNGCHALDLFAYLCGKPERVEGSLRHGWPGRGEDSFALSARSEQGALGVLHGSYLHSAPRNEWEIVGTRATLRYSYDRATDTLLSIREGETRCIPVAPPSARFARQLQEWQRVLQGSASDMATAVEGAEISHWLEAIQRGCR